MVTEGLLALVSMVFGASMSGVDVASPPSWMVTGIAGLDAAFGRLGEFSYWLPVGMLAPAVVAVVGSMTLGLALRITRMVVSILTGGGGSAG